LALSFFFVSYYWQSAPIVPKTGTLGAFRGCFCSCRPILRDVRSIFLSDCRTGRPINWNLSVGRINVAGLQKKPDLRRYTL